jgi:hypothetical protein
MRFNMNEKDADTGFARYLERTQTNTFMKLTHMP